LPLPPVADKLKTKDTEIKQPESIVNIDVSEKLGTNLPTTLMEPEEFENLDDFVFQPEKEDKKRVTKFTIKPSD